jgi:ABC-type Fe3+-hydroxamate transport system substrate-binding protein
VVSIYGIDPLGVAGPGSFTHELVERVGADAVPDEGAAFIAMDPEDLRRMDPDTVVVWAPGIEPAEERSIVDRLERLELRAVREGRVVFVRSEGALLPSTGMIEVGEELGRALRDFARPSPRGHLWELRLKTAASVSVLESPKI